MGVLARKIRTLRTREIAFVKVWWGNQSAEKATWKREDEMREKYPELFVDANPFEDESPSQGGVM